MIKSIPKSFTNELFFPFPEEISEENMVKPLKLAIFNLNLAKMYYERTRTKPPAKKILKTLALVRKVIELVFKNLLYHQPKFD